MTNIVPIKTKNPKPPFAIMDMDSMRKVYKAQSFIDIIEDKSHDRHVDAINYELARLLPDIEKQPRVVREFAAYVAFELRNAVEECE